MTAAGRSSTAADPCPARRTRPASAPRAATSPTPATVFGVRPDGREVHPHVLERAGAPRVTVLDQGATVNSIWLDQGDPASEVVVGFASLDDRAAMQDSCFGAVVGRYANRLAGARVEIDGTTHQLSANDGTSCLHGGAEGFDQRMWDVVEHTCDSITLQLTSPDADQGFPGELQAIARYGLIDEGLVLDLSARTTATTVCQLTSHIYFNLDGGGPVDDHVLTVPADHYIPVDAHSIPLGVMTPVAGGAFDLRSGVPLRAPFRADDDQVRQAGGIDHSFDITGRGLRLAARLTSSASGRSVELWSDAPALQVYTGNAFDGSATSSTGDVLHVHHAVALEPQAHPDAPHQAWSAGAFLRPGEVWRRRIEWHLAG